jgi:nitrate reductase gamma subunit
MRLRDEEEMSEIEEVYASEGTIIKKNGRYYKLVATWGTLIYFGSALLGFFSLIFVMAESEAPTYQLGALVSFASSIVLIAIGLIGLFYNLATDKDMEWYEVQ